MSPTMHDEIDLGGALRELFERQANAMLAGSRSWGDLPLADVTVVDAPRRRRSARAAIIAIAAAVAIVIGVAALGPAGHGVYVAGQPGSPTPMQF
jgi:hypothetical protein